MNPQEHGEFWLKQKDIDQRLLTLDLENKRQWYGRMADAPLVPPEWYGGPWVTSGCTDEPCADPNDLIAGVTLLHKCDGSGVADSQTDVTLSLSGGKWSGSASASTDYGDVAVSITCGKSGVTATVTRTCGGVESTARYTSSDLLSPWSYAPSAGNPSWAGEFRIACGGSPPNACPCYNAHVPEIIIPESLGCPDGPHTIVPQTIRLTGYSVPCGLFSGGGDGLIVGLRSGVLLLKVFHADTPGCISEAFYFGSSSTYTHNPIYNTGDSAEWPETVTLDEVDCDDPPPTNSGTASGTGEGNDCEQTDTPMYVWSEFGGSYPGWYPLNYPCVAPCVTRPPDRDGAYEGEVAEGTCEPL